MATEPRWIVELRGHPFDLEDLPDLLVGSPLAVEKRGDGWILSPELFVGMTDANAVRENANSLALLINGIRQCKEPGVEPISVAGVTLEGADGKRRVFELVEIKATAHARGTLRVIRNGQQVIDDDTGGWQRIAALSQSEDLVGKVLRLMAEQPPNWVGLNRIFEIIEKTSGGTSGIKRRGWATGAEMESFSGTANHPDASGDDARHGFIGSPYKKKPMEMGSAIELIRRLASRWLDSRIDATDVPDQSLSEDASE